MRGTIISQGCGNKCKEPIKGEKQTSPNSSANERNKHLPILKRNKHPLGQVAKIACVYPRLDLLPWGMLDDANASYLFLPPTEGVGTDGGGVRTCLL